MQTAVHTIYALVKDKEVYIGKTKGKRVSAVYSSHCCGEHAATCRRFAKPMPAPELHVLIRREMQDFEAYKYVLAYIRVFREAGYVILNAPRSIERSNDLKEDTQRIFDEIKPTGVSELLQSTKINKLTDADITMPEELAEDRKDNKCSHLTIRLTKEEKEHFQELGGSLHLNQRETLLYLFDKCKQEDPMFLDLEGDTYLRAILDCYRKDVARLRKANLELHEKLTASRDDKSKKLKDARESFAAVKASVAKYFSLQDSAVPIPLELEYGLYRQFEDVDMYEYPETAGTFQIRPQVVLRGHGRYSAWFVLGVTESGRYLKVRYYPRKDYVGVPIPDSRFTVRGSVWLVGCEAANDGAMDLYCSYPLMITFSNQTQCVEEK